MTFSKFSKAQLESAIAREDKLMNVLIDEMIAAGRGHEKPSETSLKRDSLSLRYNKVRAKQSELEFERRERLTYHGKLSPIKRENNPMKKTPAKSIKRKSQITGKPPTKRLVSRRAVQAKKPVRGYFPNPGRYVVWSCSSEKGPWRRLAGFASKELAFEYARAYNKQHKVRVRVTVE